MSQKTKKTTKEELTKLNAVDITERFIKSTDYMEFYCGSCSSIGFIKFNNAKSSFKNKGYSYCCKPCKNKKIGEAAKKRAGELNPFFGKKHSKETKDLLSNIKKEQIESMPKQYVEELAAKMRKSFIEKYGKNPMLVDTIKEKHHKSTHTEEFIENARVRGLSLNKNNPDFSKKMSNLSKDFWESPEGAKQKIIQKGFYQKEFNNPLGKFYDKRIESLRKALNKMFTNEERRLFLRRWVEENIDNLPKKNTSKGELELLGWIRCLGFINARKIKVMDPKTQKLIEIDVFIPDLNIGIEYNGDYWHSEIFVDSNYHFDKTSFFKERGIRIIHIFESKWKTKKKQIKSYLTSAVGKNSNKIGARKCILKEVSKQNAMVFLDQNHIQGRTTSIKLAVGLYYNNELLALSTFGRHPRNKDGLFLNRFVCKEGWTVSGALSKTTKYASNYFKKDILTWADNSISEGVGYIKSGWEVDEVLKPDYFYVKEKKVFSKQSRKKSNVGTPEDITEHEHALLDGMLRVYDCGKTRLIYKYRKLETN